MRRYPLTGSADHGVSEALFGYFPTYAFGNLYSAQLFSALKKDIPDVETQMARGTCENIKNWLRKNVHIHGKTYSTEKLLKRVTGESLNSRHFIEYLSKKFGDIYGLK